VCSALQHARGFGYLAAGLNYALAAVLFGQY
jgi:hypothetical protein